MTQQIAVVSRRDPRLGIEKLVENLYTAVYFARGRRLLVGMRSPTCIGA